MLARVLQLILVYKFQFKAQVDHSEAIILLIDCVIQLFYFPEYLKYFVQINCNIHLSLSGKDCCLNHVTAPVFVSLGLNLVSPD